MKELFDAIARGDEKEVERLLSQNKEELAKATFFTKLFTSDIANEVNSDRETPLCYAIRLGKENIAELLLYNGANAERYSWLPSECADLTDRLIPKECEKKRDCKLSPLAMAVIFDRPEIFKKLIFFSDLNSHHHYSYCRNGGYGHVKTDIISIAIHFNKTWAIPFLLNHINRCWNTYKYGILLEIVANKPPIYIAAELGFHEMLKEIFEQGKSKEVTILNRWSDFNTSYSSYSPVYIAAENGHAKALTILLAQGQFAADINNRCDSITPLTAAAKKGHTDALRELILAKIYYFGLVDPLTELKDLIDIARDHKSTLQLLEAIRLFYLVYQNLCPNLGQSPQLIEEAVQKDPEFITRVFPIVFDNPQRPLPANEIEKPATKKVDERLTNLFAIITRILLEKQPKLYERLYFYLGRVSYITACANNGTIDLDQISIALGLLEHVKDKAIDPVQVEQLHTYCYWRLMGNKGIVPNNSIAALIENNRDKFIEAHIKARLVQLDFIEKSCNIDLQNIFSGTSALLKIETNNFDAKIKLTVEIIDYCSGLFIFNKSQECNDDKEKLAALYQAQYFISLSEDYSKSKDLLERITKEIANITKKIEIEEICDQFELLKEDGLKPGHPISSPASTVLTISSVIDVKPDTPAYAQKEKDEHEKLPAKFSDKNYVSESDTTELTKTEDSIMDGANIFIQSCKAKFFQIPRATASQSQTQKRELELQQLRPYRSPNPQKN